MEPFWDRMLRYNKKEHKRFIDELDQWELGRSIVRKPGLRARLRFAGLGARVLPPHPERTGPGIAQCHLWCGVLASCSRSKCGLS